MSDNFGFVKDDEDLGFVADNAAKTATEDLGFTPEPKSIAPKPELIAEAALNNEKQQIEQQKMDRAAQAKKEEAFQGFMSQLVKVNKITPDSPESAYDFKSYFDAFSSGQAPAPFVNPSTKKYELPPDFTMPGHPDFFIKTDPQTWTLEQTQKYIKEHPAKTPEEEAQLSVFLDTKKAQVESLKARLTGYDRYLQEKFNKDLADKKEYPHEELLRDPKKLNAFESFATPYVKGVAGFFTRPFGVEPLGDVISPEMIKQAEKDHPVASSFGKAIGGIGPVAMAVMIAPETLLGNLFAFTSTGAITQAGLEKTQGSLMDKKGSEERIIKNTLKSAAYAPLWFYTQALTLGGPLTSIGTRAAARGVGSGAIEKTSGASTQEAVMAGLMTGALSGVFELTPFAIDKINSSVRNRSLDSIAETLIKNDPELRNTMTRNYTSKYGQAPSEEELTKLIRAGLTIEVTKGNISTAKIVDLEGKIKTSFEPKTPEVMPEGFKLGEKGQVLLPFNEGDIVNVAGTIGKISKIVGDNAIIVSTLGKEFATQLKNLQPTGLKPQEIPEDHLTKVPEDKKAYVKELFKIENPKVVDEFINNDPHYREAIERNKQLGQKTFVESDNPEQWPEFYKPYIDKAIKPSVPPAQGQPEAIIWIGLPGSGKTAMAKAQGLDKTHIQIDPDDAKFYIPESAADPSLADYVHKESAYMADKLLAKKAIEQNKNIIWPMVGKNPEKVRQVIEIFRNAGYKIELNYNKLSTIESKKRAYKRYLEDKRLVSTEYIDTVGEGTLDKNYEALKGQADKFASWDVNTKFGEAPKELDKGDNYAKAGEEITGGQGRGEGGVSKTGSAGSGKEGQEINYFHASSGPEDQLSVTEHGVLGTGIYFSPDKNYVQQYGKHVGQYKLNLKKTLDAGNSMSKEEADKVNEWIGKRKFKAGDEWIKAFNYETEINQDANINEFLKSQGYDSVKFISAENEMVIFDKSSIKAETQKEKVKSSVAESPKTIKEVAEETKILEPNVRRILGVGTKAGTFSRVDKGVYILNRAGKDIAYIHTGDSVETLPKLAAQGFKADMIFLDIPYKTPAVVGGNRGIKYAYITPAQFQIVVKAAAQIARDKDTPVLYMYSQAQSGLEEMRKYTAVILNHFKPVAKGEYTKLQKDGVTRVRNMRGNIIEPEGILLLTQSGNFDKENPNLNFKLIRPKGYQTEKPASMLKELIELTTEEGEIVLDPFSGSGVTIAEAIKSGRIGVGIEKDPKVVQEVILPRIQEAAKSIPEEKDGRNLAEWENADLTLPELQKKLDILIEGNESPGFIQEAQQDLVTRAAEEPEPAAEEIPGPEVTPEEVPSIIESEYDAMAPEDRARFELEMDDLRKTPEGNLLIAIKQLGGIRPYKDNFLKEELQGVPFWLKNKKGQAIDEILSELQNFGWHFDSSDALLEEIKNQAAHPIPKADRGSLRAIIREADKNKKLQQKMLDAVLPGKRRKFITTVKESPKTPPEVAKKIESRYEPITNPETLRQAQEYVKSNYNDAIELVEGPSRANVFSNAVAIVLIDKAQAEGRFADAIRIVERTAEKNTELGQAIQALSMYNRLTPEGILQYAEKQVRRARDEIKQKERITNYEKLSKGKTQAERDKLADKLGIPHISEIVAGELRKMAENIQTMPPGRDKQIEEALLLKKISDQIPVNLAKKISMVQTLAQLLNPKTFVRNILGNVGFQITENFSDTLGALLDIGASLQTGKRTVYMPNLAIQGKGLAQGMKEGTEEALLGINLKQSQSKYSLPQNGVFDKGVMGALEKTLRISLSATDRAFYQAAFNQSLRAQTLAAGVDEPTEEMIEKAHLLGLYRTFQDDNAISNFFVRLKKLLNMGKDFGLGDIVIKYPKTPANILSRGIEYSPFGFIKTLFALGRPLFKQGPFDQEDFVRSTARAFTGSALLVGAGAILAALGIISGKRAKDKDVAAMRERVGIREYQLNTSALKRFLMSGLDPEMAKLKEDDNLITYDWLLPGSIGLALGADMVLNPKQSIVDKTLNLGDRLLSASETLQEQPLVRGLKTLTSRQNLAEGVSETLQEIPASFVPTLLNQVRQLTDNTARNTKDPNYFKETYNKAIMRIPGLAGTLPEKVDVLGQTKEMYQMDSNNPFNVFLNPAFVNKYKPDPVAKMVLDIWETTGETIHFPRVAQGKIKLGSQTREPIELTPAQYTEFQKYIGNKTDVLFTILSENKRFLAKSDDEKAKALQGYLTDINTAAKAEILGYRPKHVSQDVITIIKSIGVNKRRIDKNTSEQDLGFTPEEDLGFKPD